MPPPEVVAAFDAPPLPEALLSPSKKVMALAYRKAQPTIAALSQPMLRHRGRARESAHERAASHGADLRDQAAEDRRRRAEIKVTVPAKANLSNLKFSPDGSKLAFLNTRDDGIELWVANASTGDAKKVSGTARLNAAAGDPCDWLADNKTLICKIVPARTRSGAGRFQRSRPARTCRRTTGKAAQAATYEDMIKTAHDEALFAYYFTSQLAAFDATSGTMTPIGKPAILGDVTPSPNDRLHPGHEDQAAVLASHPDERVPGGRRDLGSQRRSGEENGRPAQPRRRSADGSGDRAARTSLARGSAGHGHLDRGARRRRSEEQSAVSRSGDVAGGAVQRRAGGDREDGVAVRGDLVHGKGRRAAERIRSRSRARRGRGFSEPGAAPRKLWDRKQDAAYDNPGTPVTRDARHRAVSAASAAAASTSPIIQIGDSIYLTGQGASKEGDRPFLDRLNLKTLESERLFRSAGDAYETVVAPLERRLHDDPDALRDAERSAELLRAHDRRRCDGAPVTAFKDPQPQLRGIEHQYVTYQRKDGVKLSATLYLPPGYKKGERLPVIMWAYPREFGDADSASQVSGSPNRFTIVSGYSHLFLLLSGYAIFDNPTMPIVGPGETANDHYVDQLVASAEAAIDKVVEMGVGDRDHIGVGGHSYGAFMTANLLAHSRLFRAGFAESGAYNRTLTPFGFQSERRTFWEVPDLYAKMSPFWYADKVKDPILLMHGEADDNSGTFPIQSERFYMALKGHGATVRYVTLPNEAHGYAGARDAAHVLAERINWFDKYVKNAPPRELDNGR